MPEIEEKALDLSKMEEGRGGGSCTNPPVDDGVPEEDEDLHVSSILRKLDSITQKEGGLPKDYYIRKRRTQQERDEYLQTQTSKPHYISIGPYYHGDSDLARMENAKWKCLKDVTFKMSPGTRETFLKECLRGLKKSEEQVRKFYWTDEQTKNMTTSRFVQMLLLDVSFILTVFWIGWTPLEEIKQFFPVEDRDFMRNRLRRDLLLTDNQIPFYIIESLWVPFKEFRGHSSSDVVPEFDFLQSYRQREHPPQLIKGMLRLFGLDNTVEQKTQNQSFLHILHFYHHSIGDEKDTEYVNDCIRSGKHKQNINIPSATELEKRGMKFQLKNDPGSFLDVSFINGILGIPKINISPDGKDTLQNMHDFEWSSLDFPPSVILYVRFMADLLKNTSDAYILIKAGIMVDYEIGSMEDIPKFFYDLQGSHKLYTIPHPLFEVINKYHTSKQALFKGALVRNYRDNPWIVLSVTVGSIVLIMTFLSTFYTMLSYHHPTN